MSPFINSASFRQRFVKSVLSASAIIILLLLPTFSTNLFSSIAQAGNADKKKLNRVKTGKLPTVQTAKEIYVGAAGGKAFAFDGNAKEKMTALNTSLPVFKAFGLSLDGRKLLYISLRNGNPSGELFMEDLTTGERNKVTSRLVLNAALSPSDDNRIAYTFAGGGKFGLAIAELDSGQERILAGENVFTEILQWDDSGAGINFFESDMLDENYSLTSRYVSASAMFADNPAAPEIPAGFPVLKQSEISKLDFQTSPEERTSNDRFAFRSIAPGGIYEVSGNNLPGTSRLYTRRILSGKTVSLGEGQLVKVLSGGIVVKRFTNAGMNLDFVDWKGATTTMGMTVVDYNVPMLNSTMTQGGTGYAPPGSCAITAHGGAMEYAYDFQTLTVGAHALASAGGLVVFNTSDQNCNTVDSDSCPVYNPGGCSGTLFGNVVIIQHADGTFTKYGHLEFNSPQVAVGTDVCQGLYIARQGHTGSTNGTFNGCGDHLHFQRQVSPDVLGQSISVDFADVVSEPLSCGTNYTSASTEIAHTIAATSQSFGITGGTGSVNVTSNGCVWSATNNNNWITINSGGGSGNGAVNYTVADNSAGSPRTGTMNIGGHIFTVSQSGVQPPNQPPTVNAGLDQTITLPSSANLTGTANDDGLPNPPATLTTTWSKISGAGTITFANANALNTTATFSIAGVYNLRLTANDGAIAVTDDVTVVVNVNNGGGSLAGSQVAPPASTNLTTEGTLDWAHWGLSTSAIFNHKNGVTQQIGNYTQIGSISALRYTNNSNTYSWSDGTPTATTTNTTTGIYTYQTGNGFQITVPADTTPKTLKLYVGLWNSSSRLEAVLSDGSASPFIDNSLVSGTVLNGVYTLDYRAATSGQTLTIKWTATTDSGNITLQAASLKTNLPPPNQPPTVNAGSDQTIILPASASLSGTANDDGLPNPPATLMTTWSKVSGAGTVSFANANALNTTATFSTTGVYVLRLTAGDGALTATDDVPVTVNNNSNSTGTLSVGSNTPANVNLATEGTADWAHWGLTSANSFNHKNGVTQQISNYTKIGSGTIQRYTNNPNSYSWTGGTPTATATNTLTGLYITGVNNGFQITVPADTTQKTLRIYVGLWAAGGRFEASLSDGSAATFVDTSLVNSGGTSNRVYTINYQAGSPGQSLIIKWTTNTVFNNWSNITLQAATLVVNSGPPVNQTPTVNAGVDQTITLPAAANLSGTASDDGLPNPPATLTTTWSKVSGAGTVTFGNVNALNTTATFSSSGAYVLRLTASDSVLTAADDLTVTVGVGGTGILSVTGANTPATVNLTAVGTTDWAHWGLTSATSFNHKNGVIQQISNYGILGSGVIQQYGNNPNAYSWTGGTPTATANTATGVYVIGLNNGFQITVPADTTNRTLKVYVGLWAAGGRFEANLSDGSAATFVDTSLVNSGGTSNRVYTINYQAGSAGQTLIIKWTADTVFNNWSNVTLQAAAL